MKILPTWLTIFIDSSWYNNTTADIISYGNNSPMTKGTASTAKIKILCLIFPSVFCSNHIHSALERIDEFQMFQSMPITTRYRSAISLQHLLIFGLWITRSFTNIIRSFIPHTTRRSRIAASMSNRHLNTHRGSIVVQCDHRLVWQTYINSS